MKDWKSVLKNEELRAYLGIIAASIAVITVNILNIYENVFHAFRYAAFQVASIITTTGFYTADYELWPELSKTVLLAIMFIGASAGSTGGGIKVCRFVILIKSIRQEIHKVLHPNAVTVVKLNGRKIGQDTLRGINVYFAAYVFILVASVLIVSVDNFDFATSFSGVLTTINNVGPGISKVGPVENFHMFSPLSKIVFSFDNACGTARDHSVPDPFITRVMAEEVLRKGKYEKDKTKSYHCSSGHHPARALLLYRAARSKYPFYGILDISGSACASGCSAVCEKEETQPV